ncbi:putative disease resistance protein RGA4-like protein [Corchorus olitorius]|uniref:Disease resistance protein RGA4-like protein n=1 Tax=Corchorus olitorius TaxID=93759 RepID=A0A1R3KTG7_9ROSI|nr:putative disease resistance protein RGA4-like protein [Corchorus olitorius]
MVSAVMQQLTAVVYQEIGRGVTLVVDVRKEAQKLKTTLHTIKAVVVDAERRQVKEEAVNLWLEELKSTSYDMDDLLDEWNTCILKSQIANSKIKDLKKRLQVIAEERNLFSFDLNRGNEELVERPISTSFVDVSEIYGRDQDKGSCLRTLDLSWCLLKEIPKEIGQLMRLRYLKLSNNINLQELPETLCDLYNLQTLDLTRCRSLEALPLGIGKLLNLRHIDNWETFRLRFMPKGLERLTCLRTLKELVVSNGCRDSTTFTLGNLANLIYLGGDLKIRGLGNVTDLTEAKKAKLCNKKDLSGLTLCFDFNGRTCSEDIILEALEPPPQLERIEIRCLKGPLIFPSWLKSSSLSQLRHVILGNFRNWEHLPPLGKLPSLESLEIVKSSAVKKVGVEFLGLVREGQTSSSPSSSPMIVFPNLKSLRFTDMRDWREWSYDVPSTSRGEAESNIMPLLQSLDIQRCPNLRVLPHHLFQTTSLQELSIGWCPFHTTKYHTTGVA